MRLFDLARYEASRMPDDSNTDPKDDGYLTVTFAKGVGRLIELFTADDSHQAFGVYSNMHMGVSSASMNVLAHGKALDKNNTVFLKKLYHTLLRFQWWADALEYGEGIADLGIAYPARTKTFEPEVPEELPQTNLHRALLALSWSLGRQLSINPQEFDQYDKVTAASALGLAIEHELTDGTPFEDTLRSLLPGS